MLRAEASGLTIVNLRGGVSRVTLPQPGHFDVSFARGGRTMLGNESQATVSGGATSFDWNLQGATLSRRG